MPVVGRSRPLIPAPAAPSPAVSPAAGSPSTPASPEPSTFEGAGRGGSPPASSADAAALAERQRSDRPAGAGSPLHTRIALLTDPQAATTSRVATGSALEFPLEDLPGNLLDRYPKGERLGGGQQKQIYAVEGDPGLAIGMAVAPAALKQFAFGVFKDELDALETLWRAEVPMLEVKARGEVPDGYGIVMKRYAAGSKDGDEFNKHLNERSREDLELICEKLDAAGLRATDLQFLVEEDGSLVVADPGNIVPRTPADGPTRQEHRAAAVFAAIEARVGS